VGTPYPELAAPSRLTLARVWAPYPRFHFGEVARYPYPRFHFGEVARYPYPEVARYPWIGVKG
jgi:hypothetical protein